MTDSFAEPSCAIDCHKPLDEGRCNFIYQKAQAITENINSCYKTHNLPKIDMATIEKLKMRRMQFMHQACKNQEGEKAKTSEATYTRPQQP